VMIRLSDEHQERERVALLVGDNTLF